MAIRIRITQAIAINTTNPRTGCLMIIASTSCCRDHASDQKDDEDQPHKIFERHGDAHRHDHDQFSVSRNSAKLRLVG